jgi:hypothetical protein
VEFKEHVDFHSSESSGDVNCLITPLGMPRQKKGKQAFEHSIVEEFRKKQKESPRVGNLSKKFLALVDVFFVYVVQQGEAIIENQETTTLMNHIAENLGAIGSAPSGGSTKATIKARFPYSFAGKDNKTKWVRP